MAFARCQNCNRSIRYKVRPASQEGWLKEVARQIGQGETAVLYCINCWLVPEVGDCVVIHEPGESAERIRSGEGGVVQEIEHEGSPYAIYHVKVKGEHGELIEKFMRWQIQAAVFDRNETLIVPIGDGSTDAKESGE